MNDRSPPDPRLTGPRVLLRRFRSDDAAAVAAACRDIEIPKYTLLPENLTEDDAHRWIDQRNELWSEGLRSFAITLPPADTCVGQMGISLEAHARRAGMFYWLDRAVRGRGIASEALDIATRWAFEELEIVRAQLITHVDNLPSQRVAERCGYQREGILRSWEPVKTEQPDVVMWSRVATDPTPRGHSE